jgi:hypothetical protein
LLWRVRAASGVSVAQALMHYVREKEPEELVKNLILTSQSVTTTICEELQIEYAPNMEPEKFVSKLLWKVGFNPPLFGDFEIRFSKRLREFNDELLRNTPIETEDQRELVRGAGANLFVSVEEFVETLLAYNVWVLSSDHFVETKFRFNLDSARAQVEKILGAVIVDDTVEFHWSNEGENTLGVSLRYLDEAVKWMKSLESLDRDTLMRRDADLPHFEDDRRLTFPFRHTQLWADADRSAIKKYVDDFASIVKLLSQSNLAYVRNGIDHKRDDGTFPNDEAMFACVARLREAFEFSDVMRFFPKMFWLDEETTHRSGTTEFKIIDYLGRVTQFFGPELTVGNSIIEYGVPFLVCPGALLSVPNAEISFRLSHSSEYTRFWDGYPRRRRLPVDDRREVDSHATEQLAATSEVAQMTAGEAAQEG